MRPRTAVAGTHGCVRRAAYLPNTTAAQRAVCPVMLSREDLPALITAAGKDSGIVSLYGAHDNDTFVIDNRPAAWVVFYSERGGEFDLRRHASEEAACLDVLARLDIHP